MSSRRGTYEEEQVFTEVGATLEVLGIHEMADLNVHRRCTFIGSWVPDDHGLETILEPDNAVLAIVERRLLKRRCVCLE